jgi:hypothetical protein
LRDLYKDRVLKSRGETNAKGVDKHHCCGDEFAASAPIEGIFWIVAGTGDKFNVIATAATSVDQMDCAGDDFRICLSHGVNDVVVGRFQRVRRDVAVLHC